MKLLRNPAVVVGLVLVAAAVVGFDYFRRAKGRGRAAKPTAAVQSATNKTATAKAKNAQGKVPGAKAGSKKSPASLKDTPASVLPEAPIDVESIRKRFSGWVEAPRRDPFQVYAAMRGRDTNAPSAVDLLSLKAVWRQSGVSLAFINRRVCAEGDSLEGFTVERIESEQVLVRGPGGLERIALREFGARDRGTNRASPNSNAKDRAPRRSS